MNIERIKELAFARIADTAANGSKENAEINIEYIRGIVDLVCDIEDIEEGVKKCTE